MCNQPLDNKCCLDNTVLFLLVFSSMLFFLYIDTKISGIISIIIVLLLISCIMFTVRLEDHGCPSNFKKIAKCCKDELCNDEEEENQ